MPPTVRLEPMTREQYEEYRVTAEDEYAENIATAGSLPQAEAREKSAADFARLLPDGFETEGHRFWTAYDAGRVVGTLWLALTPTSAGLSAFGYDFSVRPELRGTGYGRAVLVAAEQLCRDLGVASVGLNVFGPNLVARHLDEQLGFEVTAVQMVRRLT